MASLKRVRVVLVRPAGAANVGAVARAMKNMALGELVLVRPRMKKGLVARAMAVHAGDVLESARVVDSLAEATKGCALVVGTTAHGGPYRARLHSPRELAPEIVRRARRQRVALVFGPEDHGLSNDDLKACTHLITIPASAKYTSLNLAQAVMVCAYELFLAADMVKKVAPEGDAALATTERMELLYSRLQEALVEIGFLPRDNPDHIMHSLRSILGRAGLDEREVRILLALARKIEWAGGRRASRATRSGKVLE